MAISFFQKMKLAFRGWSRRREQQEQEFLRKNMKWGVPPPASAAVPSAPAAAAPRTRLQSDPDREGLQAAYLDESGVIAYYLDTQNGEVVESRDGVALDDTRYKRVPVRKSEDDDRRAFIETLEPSDTRTSLMKSVGNANWRSVLATDRSIERAWYNFRNSRATAAIEEWLKRL
jgi:hypothetical protein